jgi:hypothetical protein
MHLIERRGWTVTAISWPVERVWRILPRMSERLAGCAVCGARARVGTTMSRMLVEGRALELCRAHVDVVVAAMPETFDDLRALFVGAGSEHADLASPVGLERRSPISRRVPEDRRVFPPRPEGRRHNGGRRATDPMD